jgi:signal peptidase I
LTTKPQRIWKNPTFQTALTIIIIITVVFGFWFGLQAVLNTKIAPALAVVSGSMCIPYDGPCDGWSHPFDRTLHIGDLIVIQGVNTSTLNTNYPNSDIIVFQKPNDPTTLIVHRIVSTIAVDGKLYFYTKGDGNNAPDVWPNPVQNTDYWYPDPSNPTSTHDGAVSQDYVYGKVIMRVPWIGQIAIIMQKAGGDRSILISIIVFVIILLIILEFVLPLLKNRKTKQA